MKVGTTKGKVERTKIGQQTLDEIMRSPDDSSDQEFNKDRTKETVTQEFKSRLQLSKNAAGASTYTFSQTLQNYEPSSSSDSDDEQV